jgi:hypothetical protein
MREGHAELARFPEAGRFIGGKRQKEKEEENEEEGAE